MSDGAECATCGAAMNPGLVACSYCETPYPGAPRGIDCPECGDDNRPHQVACATCNASLTRGCVFCGGASSIALSSCGRCGEAFAGAEERKAARDAQQKQQQLMGIAQAGLSMLGQAAGTQAGKNVLDEVWQDLLRNAVKKP